MSLLGRLAFIVAGAAFLAFVFLATHSEGLQTLGYFALIFGAFPALSLRFGRDDPYYEAMRGLKPPVSITAMGLAGATAWAVLISLIASVGPDLGFGSWIWVALIPGIEIWIGILSRRINLDGTAGWKPIRPLRDAAIAGASTAPAITAILLVAGEGLPTSALGGLALAVFAFGLSLVTARAKTPEDHA